MFRDSSRAAGPLLLRLQEPPARQKSREPRQRRQPGLPASFRSMSPARDAPAVVRQDRSTEKAPALVRTMLRTPQAAIGLLSGGVGHSWLGRPRADECG